MIESKNILTSVLHTAQMGVSGIDAVQNRAVNPQLQTLLQQQRQEYAAIADQSLHLAQEKGWELPHRSRFVETMSTTCAKCRLMVGDTDSTIAGMLIQGNTRGMILGIKNLNKASDTDPDVAAVAKSLLNLENMNIQKSQEFL